MGMIITRAPFSHGFARIGFFPFFFPPLLVTVFVISFFGTEFLDKNIFGIQGIILAHIFLNAPLVMHIYIEARQSISHESFRLAYLSGAIWRGIEWPLVQQIFSTAFALSFLYCTLSFTIVLILGGVKAMTLEYAIYQSLIFEYDLPRAFQFATMQAAIGLALFLSLRNRPIAPMPMGGRFVVVQNHQSRLNKASFGLLALILVGVVNLPLAIIILRLNEIFPNIFELLTQINVLTALRNSMLMAICATALSFFWSLIIIAKNWENIIWLLVSISPLILSMAYILLVRKFFNPFDYGVIFVVFVQSLAITPLMARMFLLRLRAISWEEKRLMALTLSTPIKKAKYYIIPIFKPVAQRACAIGFCLAISDLSVMPIFAPTGFDSLPVLIWRAMGQYRFLDSYALLTILLMIIALVMMFSSLGQKNE